MLVVSAGFVSGSVTAAQPEHAVFAHRGEHVIIDSRAVVPDPTFPEAITLTPGEVPVTVFLDFRCGACAEAIEALLTPGALAGASVQAVLLSRTPQDLERATRVLCAPQQLQAGALRDAFDGAPILDRPACIDGRRISESHNQLAREHGVRATPHFRVDGQTVEGFDIARLAELVSLATGAPRPKE